MTRPLPWNLDTLYNPPAFYPAHEFKEPGVEAVFYESVPWKGRSTRCFAWLGLPERTAGRKVPGIVLVHGGGGTAFAEWVRLWTARGYAAIAMDTCGCTPGGTYANRPRHAFGGPPGWGGWDQMDSPDEDHWVYHAVAAVVLGHSLLRSHPEVDSARIGITGVSWGGFLTGITAGIDCRLVFAVPVYGCGFVASNENWRHRLAPMGERAAHWLETWDPSLYLPEARMPMLWVNGTNDHAFPMDVHQMSYRLPNGPRTICIPVRMEHGHGGPGEGRPEIHAFAESICNGSAPLGQIISETEEGRLASVTCSLPLVGAELVYTEDSGPWISREWRCVTAALEGDRATAELPELAQAWYFNVVDERGLMVSNEYRTRLGEH